MSAPIPSAALRARVLAAARAEPAPPRSTARRNRPFLFAAALTIPVALSAWARGPDAGDRPCAYVVSLAIAWFFVGALATWAGVMRGTSMLGRPAGWRLLVATLTPVALLATALVAALLWPHTLIDDAGPRDHIVCIIFTTLTAAGPLAAFALVRRNSDPVAPRLAGAAIGAASGAWGALSIELHCAHASVEHIVLGHVFPVVVVTVVGALVGHLVVAVRAKGTPAQQTVA
jgi:hypothetical protein